MTRFLDPRLGVQGLHTLRHLIKIMSTPMIWSAWTADCTLLILIWCVGHTPQYGLDSTYMLP
jgi:hypothetical protein